MIELNEEQIKAVDCSGDVVVTACPGSGKTRVLTARVIRGVESLQSARERVAALTFTNRAADEIRTRIDQEGIPMGCLWAGTIHAFALEWVLRPYGPYLEEIRYGFAVADEFFCERLLRDIRSELNMDSFDEINTSYTRAGTIENVSDLAKRAVDLYKVELRSAKLIDYDEVLYLTYRLLAENSEIAANLGAIFRLFCVDEAQDIQDLQYGILAEIYRASLVRPQMFFVGDEDQSIYESLGALAKSPEQIAAEFGIDDYQHFELVGNYRSTQRVIDFCRLLRPNVVQIESRIENPAEHGCITFDNQTVHKDNLSDRIADLVRAALDSGVPENEICIVAPQWRHVRALARQLVESLPEVRFDAPGLSPIHSSRDSVWYKLARLFLTQPVPNQIRTRRRTANEVLVDLELLLDAEVPDLINSPRRLLRLTNQLESVEIDGLPYLRDLFTQFLDCAGISLEVHEALNASFVLFFEKAERQLANTEDGMLASVESFKKIFSYPSGVVVNTCHGVKGEEFDTVIAFGLLKGYVPHWSVIINGDVNDATQQETKLLYVVASRAKRQLHLLSESGRRTGNGNLYETSVALEEVIFDFDG